MTDPDAASGPTGSEGPTGSGGPAGSGPVRPGSGGSTPRGSAGPGRFRAFRPEDIEPTGKRSDLWPEQSAPSSAGSTAGDEQAVVGEQGHGGGQSQGVGEGPGGGSTSPVSFPLGPPPGSARSGSGPQAPEPVVNTPQPLTSTDQRSSGPAAPAPRADPAPTSRADPVTGDTAAEGAARTDADPDPDAEQTGRASKSTRGRARKRGRKSRRGGNLDEQDPEGEESSERPRRSAGLTLLREVAVVMVGALILTTLLRSFVFQPFEVPSGSMLNTLQIDDKIIAQKVVDFHRGDIVVFTDTNGWLEGPRVTPGPGRRFFEFVGLLPKSAEGHLVKRVIGTPGDRVRCCDKQGRITVNGHPLDEGAYLYADSSGPDRPAQRPFEVLVPAGRLFMLGDHRSNSGDSRCHLQDIPAAGGPAGSSAFIREEDVVGSVVGVMSPWSRVRRFETPQVFAGIPPPQQVPPPEAVIVPVSEGC